MAMPIRYQVVSGGQEVASSVVGAFSFMDRLRGLLGSEPLTAGLGLWLHPGASVHTLGMGFAIDVLFLDAELTILDCRGCVQPGRICLAPRRTKSTLELWSGAVEQLRLERGTQLQFRRAVQ